MKKPATPQVPALPGMTPLGISTTRMTPDELCDLAFSPGDTDSKRAVRRIVKSHDELVAAARSVMNDVKKRGEVMADHLEALNAALVKTEAHP